MRIGRPEMFSAIAFCLSSPGKRPITASSATHVPSSWPPAYVSD